MENWIYAAAGLQLALGLLELFRWFSTANLLLEDTDDSFNERSRPLGQNFAAYNILIAAGLMATLCIEHTETARTVQLWLLGSVVIAAIIGGLTTKWFLAPLQGLVPAAAFYYLATGSMTYSDPICLLCWLDLT